MNSNDGSNSSLKISETLLRAISLYKNNLALLIGISALALPFGLLESLFSQNLGFVLFPISFFVGIYIYSALAIAISRKYRNEEVRIIDCFISIRGRYWRLIGVSIIYQLIYLVGVLLFIIPGIYWATIFCFSGLVVILEERKEIGPFKLSKELVKGFFWKTFWYEIIIAIPLVLSIILAFTFTKSNPVLLGILVNLFQVIFVTPFLIVGQISLYHKLSEIKAEDLSKKPETLNKTRYGCLFAFGLAIAIIVMSNIWISQIIRFGRSEPGYAFIKEVMKRVSPSISFPDGVTFDRPSEWLVLRKTTPRVEYSLFHFKRQKGPGMMVRLSSFSLKDLGLVSGDVDLLNPDIVKKIRYENFEKNEYARKSWEQRYGIFETRSIEAISLNDRSWGKCVLVASNPASSAKSQGYVWKIYYTQVKDNMLIADFGYGFIGPTEPETPRKEIAEEESSALDIVRSFR